MTRVRALADHTCAGCSQPIAPGTDYHATRCVRTTPDRHGASRRIPYYERRHLGCGEATGLRCPMPEG